MKKSIILFIIVFWGIYGNNFAQTRFHMGIKGGVNVSNYWVSDQIETDILYGYNFGVHARLMFNENIGLQVEGQYAQQGGNVLGGYYQGEWRQEYFHIPLLLQAHFDGVFVEGGAQYSSLISSTFAGYDDTQEVSKEDIGLVVGAGYKAGPFLLGLRYALGLIDIDAAAYSGDTFTNQVLQLSLGLEF
ncbi:MAG: porin family protein [Microscillaceae bacterium]|nr:porin family protein [Microscillaceae bacterium]